MYNSKPCCSNRRDFICPSFRRVCCIVNLLCCMEAGFSEIMYVCMCVYIYSPQLTCVLIKIQLDATVCSLIYFIAKSLYMFRASTAFIIRSTKSVTAASGTGHNIGTGISNQRGQAWPRWREVAVPKAAVTVFSTPDDG